MRFTTRRALKLADTNHPEEALRSCANLAIQKTNTNSRHRPSAETVSAQLVPKSRCKIAGSQVKTSGDFLIFGTSPIHLSAIDSIMRQLMTLPPEQDETTFVSSSRSRFS